MATRLQLWEKHSYTFENTEHRTSYQTTSLYIAEGMMKRELETEVAALDKLNVNRFQ